MIKASALSLTLNSFAVLSMSTAQGQTERNYNIEGMNFDMWCQEQAHLPPDRCDKRTPEDEKTFEAYRLKSTSMKYRICNSSSANSAFIATSCKTIPWTIRSTRTRTH